MDYDLEDWKKLIDECYDATKGNTDGKIATYIPQLALVNPELYGVSFCDCQGRLHSIGDTLKPFCLQSGAKPFSYCLARGLESHEGNPKVHSHVGFEPSGGSYNAFILNRYNLPHNPLINAGAMMVCSLIEPKKEMATRFDTILKFYRRMAGNTPGIGFDNSVFLSEKNHADRNISLAYYMRENKAYDGYPTKSALDEHMDLYFQSCSITANCQAGAVMAATLANHGVCPTTGERVSESSITKDCLSIMYMCGMYDFSGQFAFEIGLPAKSGVSGCLLFVVPNIGGFCIWSPRLDDMGNSVRGVEFCKEFTARTKSNYHIFNAMMSRPPAKVSLKSEVENLTIQTIVHRLNQYAVEDAKDELILLLDEAIQHHLLEGETDDDARARLLEMGDYDNRTPLHLAASCGHVDMLRLLLEKGTYFNPKDRWGNTPLHQARKQLESLLSPTADDVLLDGDDRVVHPDDLRKVIELLEEASRLELVLSPTGERRARSGSKISRTPVTQTGVSSSVFGFSSMTLDDTLAPSHTQSHSDSYSSSGGASAPGSVSALRSGTVLGSEPGLGSGLKSATKAKALVDANGVKFNLDAVLGGDAPTPTSVADSSTH